MVSATELLKPSEASVVAGVSLRDVNRAIDEHILPREFVSHKDGRRVYASACSLLTFYFHSAKRLTSEERLLTIRLAEPKLLAASSEAWAVWLHRDWKLHDEFLTIDLAPFIRRTMDRLEDLGAARAMVDVSDDILGGTPVIRGTRIPVYDVAAAGAGGATPAAIRDSLYPSLSEDQIRLARIYAEANPLRGRPSVPAPVPEGAVILRDRRVLRRGKAG